MNDFFRDPQFLRIYHSGDPEWPGYETPGSKSASLPLLISEIFRLIPYIGSEHVQFHPKNMPEIRIDKVEIAGIVTEQLKMAKYTSYTVDDSTGAIAVLCLNPPTSENETKIWKKSTNDGFLHDIGENSELKAPFGLPPDAPYTYERHILNFWYQARDEEFSHNEVLPYDYVHVLGFCAMSFREKKSMKEVTDEDIETGRLFFFGLKLRRISEMEHNAMIKSLITQVANKRYLKPKVP